MQTQELKNKIPYKSLIYLLLILSAFPLKIQAQQNKNLSLDEAIKLGVAESKNLKYDKSRVANANARIDEAKDNQLPSASVSGNYTRNSDITPLVFPLPLGPGGKTELFTVYPNIPNNYLFHAGVGEVIYAGGRTKYGIQSNEYMQRALQLDADKDKSDIILNIVNAYYNLYKAQASSRFVDENIKQVQQHLKETQDFEQNGLAVHNDVVRIQLQLSNVQLAKIDIDDNIKVANYNLDIMLGLAENTQLVIDSNINASARTLKSYPEYLQMASGSRNDIKAYDMRLKAAQAGISAAKSYDLPVLSVQGEYLDARPNQRIFPPTDAFKYSWDAGITLSYDLRGAYTARHAIADATTQMEETKNMMDGLTDQIKMEVNQCYVGYQESLDKIDLSQKAVEQAEENNKLMTSRYDNHVAVLSDLLDASTLLLQAKVNLALAKADAEVAYNKLQKAIGNLN